jgi:hypothetical protein
VKRSNLVVESWDCRVASLRAMTLLFAGSILQIEPEVFLEEAPLILG